MPWTAADADQHVKGLSPKQARAWSAVANSALQRCLRSGKKQGDCEGQALRQAAGVAKNITESTDDAALDALIAAACDEPSDPTDPVAEAATTKQRAQAILRDLGALLSDKGLSKELTGQLQAVRTALRQRWADIADAPEDTAPAAATEAARLVAEAAAVLRQDDSLDALRLALSRGLMRWALQQVADDASAEPYACDSPYIRDLFDGAVVFEWRGQCYRADFTLGADDGVTLSDPVPVDVAYVPVGEAKADPNVGGGTDRDTIPAADFAGKNRSFPIVTPKDVADAAASLGRAGADNYAPDELKARIIAIAKRKGAAFVAQLPKAWQDGGAQEAATDPVDGDVVPLTEIDQDVELLEFAALVEA